MTSAEGSSKLDIMDCLFDMIAVDIFLRLDPNYKIKPRLGWR